MSSSDRFLLKPTGKKKRNLKQMEEYTATVDWLGSMLIKCHVGKCLTGIGNPLGDFLKQGWLRPRRRITFNLDMRGKPQTELIWMEETRLTSV